MTRSAGTGSRTWLMPALRSSRSSSMDGGADSFSLNQPSRLRKRASCGKKKKKTKPERGIRRFDWVGRGRAIGEQPPRAGIPQLFAKGAGIGRQCTPLVRQKIRQRPRARCFALVGYLGDAQARIDRVAAPRARWPAMAPVRAIVSSSMRRPAFEGDIDFDACEAAGGVEGQANIEAGVEQKQGIRPRAC